MGGKMNILRCILCLLSSWFRLIGSMRQVESHLLLLVIISTLKGLLLLSSILRGFMRLRIFISLLGIFKGKHRSLRCKCLSQLFSSLQITTCTILTITSLQFSQLLSLAIGCKSLKKWSMKAGAVIPLRLQSR